MKCQSLLSWKTKKNIVNLSSAELAERVVKNVGKHAYQSSLVKAFSV